MWILPDNYLTSSLFVQDMLESKEDLTLPDLNIESQLMWRSKPSLLRTWLTRWNRVNWLQHLSGRILKPSRRAFFEDLLISSLEATRVSRSQQLGSEKEKMTPDTFGPTYQRLSGSYDPGKFSLRMSKVTLASGLTKSSAIWKHEATIRRGEYLVRVKSALSTREKESTSWPTPHASDTGRGEDNATFTKRMGDRSENAYQSLPSQVRASWATPNTMDYMGQRSPEALKRQAETARKGRSRPANLREQVNPEAVAIYAQKWPTPTACSAQAASTAARVNEAKRLHPKGQSHLLAEVASMDATGERTWPTPTASDYRTPPTTPAKAGQAPPASEHALPFKIRQAEQAKWPTPSAHEARLGYQDRSRGKKGTQESLTTVLVNVAGGRKVCTGHLNPHWVERLMGVPDGWTRLGAVCADQAVPWGANWESDVPRVVESCEDRVDRIRLLGNGVVPQTAAKAWTVLSKELSEPKENENV